MAIGWLSVLKAVPWTEVITNAPKVADGAKKLWNSVGKKAPAPVADAAPAAPADSGTPQPAEFEARLAALESATGELHAQMLASSEVIKSLAEQNAQLIGGVSALRMRARWLSGAVLVALGAALASLAWSLSR